MPYWWIYFDDWCDDSYMDGCHGKMLGILEMDQKEPKLEALGRALA